MIEISVETHFAEDNLVPESMGILTRDPQVGKLGLDGLVEEISLETRDVATDHGGLVHAVQDAGDGGEEIRLEDCSVLEQTKRIASEVTNLSSNCDGTELAKALLERMST